MEVFIILIVLALLLIYWTNAPPSEHLHTKHTNHVYLIHEYTSEICFECAALLSHYRQTLSGEKDITLHEYHILNDYDKIIELGKLHNLNLTSAPIMVIIHDDGSVQTYRGHGAIFKGIDMLKSHAQMERQFKL